MNVGGVEEAKHLQEYRESYARTPRRDVIAFSNVHRFVPRSPRSPRCGWVPSDPLYIAYHDEEWGVPVHDDRRLFEMLNLEGAQAGLSWITILRRREGYRRAFDGFDAAKIARYQGVKIAELMNDAGIIRNQAKIAATIKNARAFLEVVEKTGSFDRFLWQFVGVSPRSPLDLPEGRPRRHGRVQGDEQGAEAAGLRLRGLHHLLRLHAGGRHGGRPHRDLLPPAGRLCRGYFRQTTVRTVLPSFCAP